MFTLPDAVGEVLAVQAFLGHKNASETLDTYGHLWAGDEDRIRAAIDAGLRSNVHGDRCGCL